MKVSGVDADVRFAVEQFNRGIEQIVTKGVDKQEVAEIVNKEFRNSKIGIDNLDKSVKELIGKSQTVQIVNYEGVTVKTSDGKKRKYLILYFLILKQVTICYMGVQEQVKLLLQVK